MDNQEREVSLGEFLETEKPEGPKAVSIDEIREAKGLSVVTENEPVINPGDVLPSDGGFLSDLMGQINEERDRVIAQANEILEAKALEADELQEEDVDLYESTENKESYEEVTSFRIHHEEDFDDPDEDEAAIKAKEELVKTSIREKIKPVLAPVDLAAFKVSSTPISTVKLFEQDREDIKHITDGALINTGVSFSIEEFKGSEIDFLNPGNSNRNEYNTYYEIWRLIHQKIQCPDKPSLEAFLKLVKFSDQRHVYWWIYKSSFEKDNVIPYACEDKKCGNVFAETISMDEMLKFESDEVKAKFERLVNSPASFAVEKVENALIQISDDFAAQLREPSIWNIIFENISLGKDFREEYLEAVGVCSFIENLYYIDRVNNTLQPIKYNEYVKDPGKTMRNRIVQYAKVLDGLTSDQLMMLKAMISKIQDNDGIKYVVPERKCTKCGKSIQELERSPEELLFYRHQLGVLATT